MADPKRPSWQHPGGKLRERGADTLTDAELLAVLIGSGVRGTSALSIAQRILTRFGTFRGMANQPFDKLRDIHGLGEVKTVRIAAAFEIARRIVNQVVEEHRSGGQ